MFFLDLFKSLRFWHAITLFHLENTIELFLLFHPLSYLLISKQTFPKFIIFLATRFIQRLSVLNEMILVFLIKTIICRLSQHLILAL